jgi:hypothetical protein
MPMLHAWDDRFGIMKGGPLNLQSMCYITVSTAF